MTDKMVKKDRDMKSLQKDIVSIDRETLIKMLKERARTITFITQDGHERIAKASLHPYILKKIQGIGEYNDDYTKGPNNDQIRFIDVEIEEWRAFNVSRLVNIE